MLLKASRSQLIVIDVQERLMPAMLGGADVIEKIRRLAAGARRLHVPILITEQYPQGLGPTIAAVAEAAGDDARVFPKLTFSAARTPECSDHVAALAASANRQQIILCGVESHVCVLQSALDFAAAGYSVFIVADAVSSRTELSLATALRRLEAAGVTTVTSEMVLFEWLERAGSDEFRELSRLIR